MINTKPLTDVLNQWLSKSELKILNTTKDIAIQEVLLILVTTRMSLDRAEVYDTICCNVCHGRMNWDKGVLEHQEIDNMGEDSPNNMLTGTMCILANMPRPMPTPLW